MRAARLALLVVAVCVPGLLMLADGSEAYADSSSPGPVSSGSPPAVAFTALEYPVRFYNRIFNAAEPTHRWGPVATDSYTWFGEVTAGGRSEDLDLSFAVEGQHDPSGYQFCETPSTCDYVNVRVTSTGLLYLHKQQRTGFQQGYFADFPTRTVELSATDADSSLKVYREVLVVPPTAVTGCEDYGEDNPDAYACLFLRELLPSDAPTGVNESTLRDSLPGLVQEADNYSLVFAEEFDGTPPPANSSGCRDGLSTLDNDVWNYSDACHSSKVDSRGEPCGNVVGGELVIADSGNCPGAGITSSGKLHAKYGYFEIKYTINADTWSTYSNYNFILFARGAKLRYLLDRYGVDIDDWEDYLTNLDIEVDILEYVTTDRGDVAHQYGNAGYFIADSDLAPIRSTKWHYYCRNSSISIIRNPDLPCRSSDTFTVTRGIEWTPRGYRTFSKVDGIQDDMIVVPKDKIAVRINKVVGNRPGPLQTVTGTAKDTYFEYLDPDDTDSLLEQVAVSHVPLPMNFGTWGWLGSSQPYIRTRMKIDYVRLWQPENHYADMEPVYQ